MKLTKTRAALSLALIAFLSFFIYSCEKSLYGGMSSYADGGGYSAVGKIDSVTENPFLKTADSATSTFSIDADGASYAIARRLLSSGGNLSSYKEALRTEEFINYFTYDYPNAAGGSPIGVNGEVSACPWNSTHKLIRIGIKGKSIEKAQYPAANFILLIDVSGSMSSDDKLALLKDGFIDFVNQMRPQDKIGIVTYAGSNTIALEPTAGTDKNKIINAIKALGAGGSTNGADGIKTAYELAEKSFIAGGNNRVILGTDGDFNVGITNTADLISLIEAEREKGVFLTSLGVGLGNFNESMMEKVANHGNGNLEYIDSKEELKKVFVDEYNKFVTVGKDVKVQVTFNPDVVEEYRLIGYENRMLQSNDFTDDKKDAGEIGAGQTITAIYEVKTKSNPNFKAVPTFSILFRYKEPAAASSEQIDLNIFDEGKSFDNASENMRFAGSLAALGLYLRESAYKGTVTIDQIKTWAGGAKSFDPFGYRAKHVELLKKLK